MSVSGWQRRMEICGSYEMKSGANRFVFVLWRYAIKIPNLSSWKSFVRGLAHNMTEREFSRMGIPELCPVVFYVIGGFCNVMPRCECGFWPGWDDESCALLDEWVAEAEKSEHSALILNIVEMKQDSVGRLPCGRVVAVDYGVN